MKKADRMALSGFKEICKARASKAARREHKTDEKVRRYNKSGYAPTMAGSITSYLIAENFQWTKDDDLECNIEALKAKGKKRRRGRKRSRGPSRR